MDFGYSILKVELTGFAKRWDRGCEREGEVKGNDTYFGLSNLNGGVAWWVGRSSVLHVCITWLPVRSLCGDVERGAAFTNPGFRKRSL